MHQTLLSNFASFVRKFSLSVALGSALGALVASSVIFAAFQPPTAAPPGNNVAAPLNTSGNGQIKLGGLTLNSSGVAQDGLIILNGYTQLGRTTGLPPAADCNESTERGRMKVDSAASALYICMDTGWVAK